MSGTPELDQVAHARRQLAAHSQFPAAYWVLFGIGMVLVAGLPIWISWLNATGASAVTWVIAAVGIASSFYSFGRRRRSGVSLPKRIGSYPGAWPWWLASVAVTLGGLLGITALVGAGQRGFALLVLPVVALLVLATQLKTRSAMRRDLEEGRVRP
ncbi:hypothetical protein EIL87_01305 [Saccharopolyspora rhizosphaerae]|uniref:Uncharacterized protein n=1 Tax=Saccharopolyspora rhizosphaerae TaxID=2492662 RepID=A0A3R8P5G3_9PSEU|nr:hypothetical protein [Saccharopolyspora rhizosphaerae]RRO20553.1 hypothetical protein EIL87_01305 [Saccharopolyspora rhizosphaerae]